MGKKAVSCSPNFEEGRSGLMISRINAAFVFEFAFSSDQGYYYYYPLVYSVLETDRRLAFIAPGD